MKAINKSLEPVLKSAIMDSLKAYQALNKEDLLSDLFIYYDKEAQTLTFFDDVEKELLKITLSETLFDHAPDVEKQIRHTAKSVLKEMENEHVFDREFIYKPFSISLIDNDFIVLDELIFIDDHTLKLDGDLWKNLNRELDDFLKTLMQ